MATVIESKIGKHQIKIVAVEKGESGKQVAKQLGVYNLGPMDGHCAIFIGRGQDVADWSDFADNYDYLAEAIEKAGVDTSKIDLVMELSRRAYQQSNPL